nr:hypothetical protein Iba_chr04fCG15280 [Ipomoea batatas]
MLGEQDGVCEDLFAEVRPFQDPSPGLLGRLQFALELLDSLLPLREGLLELGNIRTVDFVAGDAFPDQASRPSARLFRRQRRSTNPRQQGCRRFVPVLHEHVHHRGPGRILFAAQAGGDRCFDVRIAALGVSAFLDPRLIFVAGASGQADTGKLLMAPKKGRKTRNQSSGLRSTDLSSVALTNLANRPLKGEVRR